MSELPTSESAAFDAPAGPPTAILAWSHSGGYLLSRQSQALADYWSAIAHAAQPNQAVTAGLGLWGQLWDGYATALSEAAAPLSSLSRAAAGTLAAE